MRQETFERRHRAAWDAVSAELANLEAPIPEPSDGITDLPARYRRLCQHLALARYRGYSTHLISHLNRLAVGGHHQLYQRTVSMGRDLRLLVARDFPRAFRAEWRLVLLAHLLFYGPFLGMMAGIAVDPALVYSVVDPGSVAQMEAMYDPASDHHLQERPSDSDIAMFGFYIRNNIGIAFRTFAGGVLAGAGSLFFLVYNGFVLGAVAGHLTQVGFASTFWPFVITHGSVELTAIVLAGVAGLRLGLAVLAPGRRSRGRALAAAGRRALPILYGLTGFLVLAAFIEAFWSSSTVLPVAVKLGVGGAAWVLTYAYLLLAGRPRGA